MKSYFMDRESSRKIFFDLDDTLIDTSFSIVKRLMILLDKYPVKEGLLFLHNLLPNPNRVEILASRYNFSNELWQHYEELREEIKPLPIGDVKTKLELIASEAEVGLLTNASQKKIDYSLKVIGVSHSFFGSGVYGRDNLKYPKPDARCINEVGTVRDRILYIGDDIQDYLFTLRSGISFLAVCTGLTSRETFKLMGVSEEQIFPSVQEVELNASKM